MKKFKLQKIIASMLALVMIVTMIPATANAASTKTEKENNNTASKANALSTSYAMTGALSGIKDADFYVYKVGNTGLTDITFKITGKNMSPEHSFYIALYNGKNQIDYAMASADQKTVTFKNLSFKKGTKLYLCISGLYEEGDNPLYKPSDKDIPKGIKYAISVKNTKKANWETEDNNTMAKADTLKTKISGVVNYCFANDDVDYFVFTAKESMYDVTLTTNKKDQTHTMHIYNAKGKELAYDDFVYSVPATLSVKTTAGEKYYVAVSRASQYEFNATPYAYSLTLSASVDADYVVGCESDVTLRGTVKKKSYTLNSGKSAVGYVLQLDEQIVAYDVENKTIAEISEIQLTGTDSVLKANVGKNVTVTGQVWMAQTANYCCGYYMTNVSFTE